MIQIQNIWYVALTFETLQPAGEFTRRSLIVGESPKPTYSVLCSTGDYLDLTESAAEVLKFVLFQKPDDWFWIDQICINQSDLAERSAQVSMMGQVYSSASQAGLYSKYCSRSLFVKPARSCLYVDLIQPLQCTSSQAQRRKG